jgi:diguanylate cyclase (GGDEF)-like protein/PAS domain S-box-containing protein
MEPVAHRPALLPPLLLALGLAATALLSVETWNDTLRDREQAFAEDAARAREAVAAAIGVADEMTTVLATLVNSAAHVDADQFRIFSEDALGRHPFILSTGYLPLVLDGEREQFERGRRHRGYPTFSITQRDDGRYFPAATQPRYFPLYFQEPFEPATAAMIGFDVHSDPELGAAVRSAIDSAVARPSQPRTLAGAVRGYWLFRATYNGKIVPATAEGRRKAVNALVALRVDAERILRQSLGSGRRLEGRLRMQPGGSDALVDLVAAGDWARAAASPAWATYHLRAPIEVGGQRLELELRRTLGWRDLGLPYLLTVAAAGLTGTALLFLAGRIASLRARERQQRQVEIERQVAEKTAELAIEKERAEVTLASIGDAVITADAAGRVEYLNPAAERLTGWPTAEARGIPLATVFDVDGDDRSAGAGPDDAQPVVPVGFSLRESVLTSRDGTTIPIDQSASPIRGRDGATSGTVLVFHDISHQQRIAREMSYQASHDGLTDLANRRAFELRLEELVESARAHDLVHALLYLDLDQFKIVNDACGHFAGDQLLRQVSSTLRKDIRGGDMVARLGGDEFGVLLERCLPEDALHVAGKLQQAIDDLRFTWKERTFPVGVSVGLVPIYRGIESPSQVLGAADAACYAAKEKGRNRVQVYQPDDRELAQRRTQVQWVARLTRALEDQRFLLYAQPIVPLGGRRSGAGQEVLVRLLGEDGQLVPPGAFIPAAERYHLMGRIDRWVVGATLRWLAAHLGQPGLAPFYSINLSGPSLSDEQFVHLVGQEIDATGVPPELICFEITETSAVASVADATRFMNALREKGCRFSLDDFGSGWSSFSYLKNLPVDFLKIDGEFVRDITQDPLDQAIVGSINEIGHTMGLQTIAEFVETPEILERLQALGIDYAQGYAVAEPRPIDEHLRSPSIVARERWGRPKEARPG